MFGKQHMLTLIAQAVGLAAVVAAFGAPSALAHGNGHDRTRAEACQGSTAWTTITDDLGLDYLVPAGHGSCAAQLDCTPATGSGWISVSDDLGIPGLVQTGTTDKAGSGTCLVAQTAPAPASKIARRHYRGWAYVKGADGSSKLVSISDLRGY